MTRYVVTGGAGFIGSALVRSLLARGDGQVRVIDNLLTGHEANLADLRSDIEWHHSDIRDAAAMLSGMRGANIVFHLAAIPSVPRSIKDPESSHQVNINGTFNVLRACVDAKVQRVVYAASSSAYGDTDVLPKVETMLPRPKSPYAVQKLVGEHYASVFHSCFDLETVALRFFNVYGERQDPSSPYSGVLSLFLNALIERQPPTIFGDGEQTRDFTYVQDVAALCCKAAWAPGVAGKVYNAGNGNRYSLNYIWDLLQKIEGISLTSNYERPRAGDVRDSQADTTAARRDLGHEPQYSLEQGLTRTLAWYRTTHPNDTDH
jgi:nucleoside-diphosphate-sugar epimerase